MESKTSQIKLFGSDYLTSRDGLLPPTCEFIKTAQLLQDLYNLFRLAAKADRLLSATHSEYQGSASIARDLFSVSVEKDH